MEAQLESLQGSIARYARENSTLRISLKKHYEAQRRLENAIRRHVLKECDCRSHTACIVALGKLVPKHPRPAYKRRPRQGSKKT